MTEISYQLYSSREFPPLRETLSMLSGLGYSQVEGFGGVFEDTEELATLLKMTGMSMTSGHFGIDMLEHDIDSAFKIADAAGMKAIFCPYLDAGDRPTDAAGWRALGKRLEAINKKVTDHGLQFGWHNHDFEFIANADGSIPMEEIFMEAQTIGWEADLAWIARAGADPLDWVKRFGDRMIAVHIKDIAPKGECRDEDGWADVGHGTMDWAALLKAVRETPNQYFVMEHDKPSDHQRFASRSIATVKQIMGA